MVAADWPAFGGTACVSWRYGDDQHPTAHLAHHQPMRWRLGRIEQRIRSPYLVDVVDAEPGMLEQMDRLLVDLEGILLVETIDVESLGHTSPV